MGRLEIESLNICLIKQHFRLLGVNTPERGKELADEATAFTAGHVLGKEITVSVFGRDSFGRLLTVVHFEDGTLNDKLLKAQLAAPFNRK